MTCRGCSRPFTKYGMGAPAPAHPLLCADCAAREICFHGYHAGGVKCLAEFLGKKEATHGRAS